MRCILQVLAFDAFCQAIKRDMKTVLAMMDATAGGFPGQPAPSLDSRAPRGPVVAGLTAALGEAEAAPLAKPFDGRTSSPEAHLNPFWGLHKTTAAGGAGADGAGLQVPFAAGAAAAPAAPLAAAVLPFPVTSLPVNAAPQRGQLQLQAGPATPAASPTEAEAAPSWGFQQRPVRAAANELRRSFDVGAAGRQRRPIHAVNCRTSLLSMISMGSAAPTS